MNNNDNKFEILYDCHGCNNRYILQDMTFTEHSKVLCLCCMTRHKLDRAIKTSSTLFKDGYPADELCR